MASLLLLHHVLGVTPAVRQLAASWEDAGHEVIVPDLYDGRTYPDIESGMAASAALDDKAFDDLAEDAAAGLGSGFVVCGLSLGVVPAMNLAISNDAVAAVVAVGSCIPAEYLPGPWPASVPLRVLASAGDEMFNNEGDLDAAKELVNSGADVKVKLMPGDEHLFMEADDADSRAATSRLYETVLRLLSRIDEDLPTGANEEEDRAEGVAWDLP
jgi:dienelactone hydrolase